MRSGSVPRAYSMLVVLAITHLSAVGQSCTGPRLGLGLATQSTGGLFQNTTNPLPRPIFGWFYQAYFHPQVCLMPELDLVTKGYVYRNAELRSRSRGTYKYLEMPVLVKMSTDAKPHGLFLTAGPILGYYVSGRYKTWQDGNVQTDSKLDLSSAERWQFSLAVGIGSEWEKWEFEFRAQSSITPFDPVLRTQNVLYGLTFGYRITPAPKAENDDG